MLSKRIRELRLFLGLNQVQFGQVLNVTKQTISNWENDNIQPSVEMLTKIVNIQPEINSLVFSTSILLLFFAP